MTTIDYIKLTLEMSNGWIMGLAEDAKDIPMQPATANGGNHPLWCVGHLVYAEANLISVMCKGEEHPLANWKDLFDAGSTPSENADAYPSMEELLAKAAEVRTATMEYLGTLTDADLDKPSHAEGEMKEWFGTIAQCLAAITVHVGFHGGQIADARRAAGRAVLMG